MSLKGHSSIFESPSQRVDHIDPKSIRLTQDRLLLRDLGDPEMIGSIVIPESAREIGIGKNGNARLGLVIAVGPGNRFFEMGVTDEGEVRRKAFVSDQDCEICEGRGRFFAIRAYENVDCMACYGYGKKPLTIPTECQPGDLVAYDRRKEAEWYINGERYCLCYEEQAVLMVIERCRRPRRFPVRTPR